ncbi:MAG: hypothetical protein DRG31_04745 [Deltaproteobacteria bacterium]|nr:MAG: hypothetical protein DRG31_04745 [Deltaproteobacteria bacterium]
MEDRERLRVMIEHWIRHNESHFEEYRRWAEVARALGLEGVDRKIQEAVDRIREANRFFEEALRQIV